jgi:hypothetical protein
MNDWDAHEVVILSVLAKDLAHNQSHPDASEYLSMTALLNAMSTAQPHRSHL